MENQKDATLAPASTQKPTVSSKPTATMRHPHTGDTVEATQEELIPLMYRGYEQVPKDQAPPATDKNK